MEKWPLPIGWEWKTVAEVSKINPRRPHIKREDHIPTSFVPMAAVDEVEGKISELQVRSYSEVRRGYTYFEENDVVLAKITPSMENGKVAIAGGLIDGFGFGTTEFHVFRPKPNIFSEWLHKYLRRISFRQEAKQHFRGTAGQKRVPKDFLTTYPIPLPYPNNLNRSLAIQRYIVAQIERHFGELQKMRALNREVKEDTEQVMDAFLQQAMRELVMEHNSYTVKELKQRNLLSITGGGTPSKQKSEYWAGSIPWVSPKEMKTWIIENTQDHITPAAIQESSTKRIKSGSVLVVVRGMILARTWPVAIAGLDLTINQDIKALVPQEGLVGKYLGYMLRALTPYVLTLVDTAAHGTKRLKTEVLEALKIPLPPKREQQYIVASLEAIESDLKIMQETPAQNERTLQEVEQMILTKAFRGEL